LDVSIRQHTSAYVSIRRQKRTRASAGAGVESHTYTLAHIEKASAYTCVSIRQHPSASVSTRRRSRSTVAHVHLSCPNAHATSVWGLTLLVYEALSY
jgi:hypothetical protein